MSNLRRGTDFVWLNWLLNHPLINPWIGGNGSSVDASVVDKPNIILEAEYGAFWFIELSPGVWDAHTQFLPDSVNTYELGIEAIEYIRAQPGYKKITTQGPRDNPRAIRFLEKLGFKYTHTHGELHGLPLDHYEKI